MPWRFLIALAILGLSACSRGSNPELDFRSLESLRSQATHTVDVNLGPFQMAIASWMLDGNDPDTEVIRNTLKACKSVHIRSYEFGPDFEYPRAEIDALQSQLSGRGWSPLATVRDRNGKKNVDVYIALEHEKITGLVVLVSGPRDLTIVNVVGSLDASQIDELRTHFSTHSRHASLSREAPPDL
jgi:hypothetical protein